MLSMKLNPLNPRCSICSEPLHVTELTCPGCATSLRGRFELSPLGRLAADQAEFAVVFLQCRGNIREVEKALGISYPTVRGRLEAVIEALSRAAAPAKRPLDRRAILDALERGEISAEEAIARLGAPSDEA